jgi:hypothetical protein
MAKFDLKIAKQKIGEINAIVETCPEALKVKCFELLFTAVFGSEQESAPVSDNSKDIPKEKEAKPRDAAPIQQDRKLPSNVLAFARRHTITTSEIEKLFILDHEPILPVYKVPTGNMAKAQLYKVMMVLLLNGLLNNQLAVPYPELRETLREDGLFDGNFNKMLKRNHALFKGAVTKGSIQETGTVELSGAGFEHLAQLIKDASQN